MQYSNITEALSSKKLYLINLDNISNICTTIWKHCIFTKSSYFIDLGCCLIITLNQSLFISYVDKLHLKYLRLKNPNLKCKKLMMAIEIRNVKFMCSTNNLVKSYTCNIKLHHKVMQLLLSDFQYCSRRFLFICKYIFNMNKKQYFPTYVITGTKRNKNYHVY